MITKARNIVKGTRQHLIGEERKEWICPMPIPSGEVHSIYQTYLPKTSEMNLTSLPLKTEIIGLIVEFLFLFFLAVQWTPQLNGLASISSSMILHVFTVRNFAKEVLGHGST